MGRGWTPWRTFAPALVEELIAALPYSIAALDRQGVIIATNEAWRRFAHENGASALADSSTGQNYLDVCRHATGPFADGASEALRGIQAVLDGSLPLFTLEYPCPSPTQQRWFLLHVTPLPVERGGAIVSHIDIPRRRSEEESAQELASETEARAKAEATAKRLNQLQIVTDTALSHWELPALESALMERIQQVMAVDYVWLMRTTEDGRELVMRATRGPEIAGLSQAHAQVGQGLMGRIAISREPLVVDDLDTVDVAYREFVERGGIRSLAGAPLLAADRLVGVLSIGSKQPRHFTPEDVDFLRLIGDRIALALEHARLDDSAQRAHAEAEARANQLAAVVEAITDPLVVFDREGNILFQNTADRALLGLAPDAPNPRTTRERAEIVPLFDLQEEPVPLAQRPSSRILRGETLRGQQEQDFLIHTPDGRTVVASASGSPIRDAEGNLTGGALVIRDVTARRSLERELTERANELAVIVESISDALVVIDREGNILFQNAADRAFMGLASDAPGPRTLHERGETLRLSDLQGRPLPRARWGAVRVLQGETLQGPDILDVTFQRADGSEVVASISGGPIRDARGNIVGGVLVTRDVTERRKAERHTQTLLEALLAMAEALVSPETPVIDASGVDPVARHLAELTRDALGCKRISISTLESEELWMHAVARMGWPPEDEQRWFREAWSFRLTDLIPPPLVARLRAGETILSPPSAPWSTAPDSGEHKILVAPLRVRGELIGALGLDYGDAPHTYTSVEMSLAGAVGKLAALVLERDRLLREREAAIASELAARQVKERMDEFLAMATHDLRSPITAGKLAASIARRRIERQITENAASGAEFPVTAIRSNLEIIEGSMNRLVQLVNRLMDVSRVRAGKLSLELEPCDLARIVRQAVEEQRLLAPGRPLRLSLPSSGAVMALADADRVGQVVTNFLTNAVRYAPGESPIEITLRVAGHDARLSVRDRGPGIPAEEQVGIWERFQQAEQGKAAAKSGGLGIGLYISREIVHLHGGEIGVLSAPGRGSTFWFMLPLIDQGADGGDHPASQQSS